MNDMGGDFRPRKVMPNGSTKDLQGEGRRLDERKDFTPRPGASTSKKDATRPASDSDSVKREDLSHPAKEDGATADTVETETVETPSDQASGKKEQPVAPKPSQSNPSLPKSSSRE